MASDDASMPGLAADIHVELVPSRQKHRQTLSKHEQRRTEARLIFNKIIAGHYRETANDYSQVGALFVTWEVNDLQLGGKDTEVSFFQKKKNAVCIS
jgi:hypothetical protein